MVKKPLVSVVILNYNGRRFIETCLKSVLNDTFYSNFEVILIDNASTDGSIELVKRRFERDPRLIIVRNNKNLGFAEGNNVGVRYARGEYIVFLNSDTVVDNNWLTELVKVMNSDQIIGAAQSKLLLLRQPEYLDSAGDYIDYYGLPIRRGGGWKEKDYGQYNHIEEIFSARGAAMIVRRSVISEVGLFDPKFFLSYEDIDLCWRIRLRGYKVVFVPKSVIYHLGEASSPPADSPQKIFHMTKNHIATMLKNSPTKSLEKYNPLSLITLFMIMDLIKRRPILFMVRIKAIVWIIRNFKYVWRERVKTQIHIRKCRNEMVMKYMLKTNFTSLFRLFVNAYKYGYNFAIKNYFEKGFSSKQKVRNENEQECKLSSSSVPSLDIKLAEMCFIYAFDNLSSWLLCNILLRNIQNLIW